MMRNYNLIRSKRKTLSIQIKEDLSLIVRAPLRFSRAKIDQFVEENEAWIVRNTEKMRQRQKQEQENAVPVEDVPKIKAEALDLFISKTKYYEQIMNLHPAKIKITSAKKRFGSCTCHRDGTHTICYSYRLMFYPDAAIDYVVVHELAHIRHKNHGKAFYGLIESVLPDYKERIRLLK